jgi:hypothetical protein
MPVKPEIRRGKDRRKIVSSSSIAPAKDMRQNKDPHCFESDEDKLYDPDWEEASDSDLESYVEISHQN